MSRLDDQGRAPDGSTLADQEGCACCGYPTTDLEPCDGYATVLGLGPFSPDEDKPWLWLCNVCRSTQVGNTALYPRNYSHDVATLGAAINYGTNAVLAAIAAQR